MLGRVLEPFFDVRFEEEPLFSMFTEYALRPNESLLVGIKTLCEELSPDVVLKIHPSIWFPFSLLDARMVVIRRNAPDTIASMMKHGGVLSWFQRRREFPSPNNFLGITEELAPRYDDLPLEVKCFLWWQSHWARSEELRLWGNLVVEYEDFERDARSAARSLYESLGVSKPLPSFHWEGRQLRVA